MADINSQFPTIKRLDADKAVLKDKVLAQLRQNIWEASQFTTLNAIESYVQSVLREIESDEP